MKKIVSTLSIFLFFCFWSIEAHEYWIHPEKYLCQPGETIAVDYRVGDHFTGDRWGGGSRRIKKLNYQHHGRVENIIRTVRYADSTVHTSLRLGKTGTQAISLFTNNSYIELDADKFNKYLKEDGLDHILAFRDKHHTAGARSREYYRRCAKTLIQVGESRDQGYTGAADLILEIIPVENPYSKKPGETVNYKILYKNKPLENGLVRFWNRDVSGMVTEEQARTDVKGEVSFVLKKNGEYMVSVVWMEPWKEDDKADFISTWGSLTFGS